MGVVDHDYLRRTNQIYESGWLFQPTAQSPSDNGPPREECYAASVGITQETANNFFPI